MLFSYIRHLPKMSPKIQYPLPNIDLSEIIVPGLEEAYPTIADELVKEVNYYERAWSALDKAVTFYGEAESDTMTDAAGSYVLATNTFAFGEDSRFGRKTVLENVGKYKVIDQPADIGITAGKE